MKAAIPLVARRRRLTQELVELGDVIRLRDDFGAESRTVQDQLRLAELAITQSCAAILQIDAQLTQLAAPQGLLNAAGEIEALQERFGAVEKARSDRTAVEHFQHDSEHQARRILRDLGRPVDLDLAETLRLRTDEPTIIHKLGQQSAKLRGQAEEGRKTIARHDDEIRRLQKEQVGLEQPRDVEPLRRAIKKARESGDLEIRLIDARAKLALAEKKASMAFAQLPSWCRPPEELERLAVPLSATLDQYESQFQEATRQRETLAERLTAQDEAIGQLEIKLQSLELQQDVPTEEALLTARNRREEGWQLVKAAWLGGAPEGKEEAAFLAESAPGGTLAVAFEQSVERADALADRLRREAERIARRAEWLAQLRQHRRTQAALAEDARLLDDRLARREREWNALIGPLGIAAESQTPIELRAWLRRRTEVIQLFEQVDDARRSIDQLEARDHDTSLGSEPCPRRGW